MAERRHAPRFSRYVQFSALWHAGALGALALEPRRWPLVVAALVANHASLAGAGLWPRCSLLGPNLRRLPAGPHVALTFDDGPDPSVTPRVSELLAARGVRATFFCIGRNVLAHRTLVAELAAAGHEIANHSHTHPLSFYFLPPAALAAEIDRAQEAIATNAGRVPRLFRAPAGIRSPLLQPLLASRGLQLVSWTRRAFDTVSRDPQSVARRLTRGLSGGDILLLHDGQAHGARGGDAIALEALPRVLDALAERGLEPVPLGNALSRDGNPGE